MKSIDKLKYSLLGAVIMLCAFVLAPDVIATAYSKIIEVSSGIKIHINDEEFVPKDVNGKEVEVFLYNGTTYLPVRAVAEFNGYEVLWDGKNDTVKLYTSKNEIPDSDEPEQFTELSIEDQVLALINEIRQEKKLTKLQKDNSLAKLAETRAKELNKKFAHTRPNGTEWHTVLDGVSFSIAGENLAMGYLSAEEVVDAWMNSEGHRENILDSRFDRIGISHYIDNKGVHYWTQLFAGD